MSRQSFIKGAMILAAGSLISRAMGGVYRFVLPWIMGGGDDGAYGMALFGYPYSIYSIALSLSAAGIPLAISKLVAEQLALGNTRGAVRVFRVAITLLIGLGLLVSLSLYLGAGFFAERVFRNPDTYYSVVAIAPAAFFVSIKAGFRGFFQGMQDMVPTAMSQVIEQIIRIATMLLLASLLLPLGLHFSAAGATFGAVTGSVVGLTYLIVAQRRRQSAAWIRAESQKVDGQADEPAGRVVRRLADLAIPISLTGIVLPVMRLLDAAVVPSRLQGVGFSAREATVLFGYLDSYAMPFVNVPAIFTTALAISMVPAVAERVALKDWEGVKFRVQAALRLTVILGLPAAVGLFALSSEIPYMMWRAAEAGPVLASLAWVTVFLTLQQTSSGILQGVGLAGLPVRHLFLAAAVKLILTWVLSAIPALNVGGAALATVVGFMVASMLNLRAISRRVGPFFNLSGMVLKPVLSAGLMAAAVRLGLFLIVPHLGVRLATVVVIGLGAAVYGLSLLLSGGIQKGDLELIPRYGDRLVGLLGRLGVMR